MRDLHVLPKVRDSWSYVYVEHAKIDQDAKAIALWDQRGRVPVPCAALSALLLGPGTSITHAAIRTLAESGCSVMWVGEEGVRYYAQGLGETRSARKLLRQAYVWADPATRLEVVKRMYRMRFREPLDPDLTLQQIRGREGIRVREAYARASRETGVPWSGRTYRRDAWEDADDVNRALSAANSCLYGVCHAAIVAAGYSPGLGFIHTGKQLSFVYDIADLYKADVTIPAAFQAARDGSIGLEGRVRRRMRDFFHETQILKRVVDDIERALFGNKLDEVDELVRFDWDMALPGGLWDPDAGTVAGGQNYGNGDEAPTPVDAAVADWGDAHDRAGA